MIQKLLEVFIGFNYLSNLLSRHTFSHLDSARCDSARCHIERSRESALENFEQKKKEKAIKSHNVFLIIFFSFVLKQKKQKFKKRSSAYALAGKAPATFSGRRALRNFIQC
jgi:hypothetical protein